LDFNDAIDQTKVRDLVIFGAGPSRLAATIYGLQKGLTFMFETGLPSGQAD